MRFWRRKTIRDGLAQASGVTNSNGALDYLITNAVILDPILGILKADIGIKDGKIAGIGKAGNPYDGQGQSQDGCISLIAEATAGEHTICIWPLRYAHTHDLSSTIHRRNQQRYL